MLEIVLRSIERRVAATQPDLVGFVSDHTFGRRERRMCLELVLRLLEAYGRYGRETPRLSRRALDEQALGWMCNADDPVDGWRYALPIGLPAEGSLRVSRIMGAVVGALDERFRSGLVASTPPPVAVGSA